MASQTRSYFVQPAQLAALRTELEVHDIHPPIASNGIFNAPHGFTVGWAYDAEHAHLAVTLNGSAFLMGLAWGAVESGVEHVGGARAA